MKKDKLLQLIDKRWRDGSSDWRKDLEGINIWNSIAFLYDAFDRTQANQLLAYVVYGYSLHSPWLEPEKDRYENLERIMETVTGTSAADPLLQEIIHGKDEVINQLIDFVLDNQDDARFRHVVATYELQAQALRLHRDHTDPKKLLEVSTLLRQVKIQREEAQALHQEIEREFEPLSTALVKEGRQPVEAKLELSWKSNIDRRKAEGTGRAIRNDPSGF